MTIYNDEYDIMDNDEYYKKFAGTGNPNFNEDNIDYIPSDSSDDDENEITVNTQIQQILRTPPSTLHLTEWGNGKVASGPHHFKEWESYKAYRHSGMSFPCDIWTCTKITNKFITVLYKGLFDFYGVWTPIEGNERKIKIRKFSNINLPNYVFLGGYSALEKPMLSNDIYEFPSHIDESSSSDDDDELDQL
jgi:hypothetical protein